MSSIRVKLIFERPLVKLPEQCWMLVDKNLCKIVRDLEYLIVKKFFVAGHTILNLYLDDFLLPPQEKIDLVRDNDVIRVVEERNNVLINNDKSGKTNVKEKIKNSKKRKFDESNDSKSKSKKLKHSSNKNSTSENNTDRNVKDKQSNLPNVLTKNDSATIKNSLDSKSGSKISSNNFEPKVNSTTEAKLKQKKFKKRQKKGTKDKSIATKLNNFWDKLAGTRHQWNSTDVSTKTGTNEVNGDGIVESSQKGNEQDDVVLDKVQKNNGDLLSREKSDKGTSNQTENTTHQRLQGNHIRFDNEESNSSTDVLNNVIQPLQHPQVLSIAGTNTPTQSSTPNLSPIEPNTENRFTVKKSFNGNRNNQKDKKGPKRKDSYTNKSQILESTRVEKDPQSMGSKTVTTNTTEKDFSVYPLLHGPPRVGDTVVYKMIELSQSYTPEVSKYKEGKVLSYDALTQSLKLKLTKESLERVKGDGHVSLKFELFNNEDDDGASAVEEISDERYKPKHKKKVKRKKKLRNVLKHFWL